MSTELPKNYDPAAVEATAYQTWLDEKSFHADPANPGPAYTIVIPPPNVTGALHLGHAINGTLQDILVRSHRMAGFNTLWVPGIDHAGIATQAVVEKQLKEKENKTRHDVGRECLVERIWAWKQQYGDRIISQLKRVGCSCDWDRTRFTLDDMCARAVRHTFFKLFKDGLIYRGKRLVNWDVFLQTSVSDDEIYHETVKTHLWHIRYPIVEGDEKGEREQGNEGTREKADASDPLSPVLRGEGGGEGSDVKGGPAGDVSTGPIRDSSSDPSPQPSPLSTGERGPEDAASSLPSAHCPLPTFMIVATTRPETMLGDTAVAVHSQDPRWNWAIGKHVRLPLTNRLIPIIADDILVDPKFGTGVVKVTPAHDPNDYAVWNRHLGKPDAIDILNILTPEGNINEVGGPYAGLRRDVARKRVVDDLASLGLLEKEEPYETQVGHSDRSKTPIEPYLSDQWFIKMAPLAEPALEAVRDGRVKFTPERYAHSYLSWLGEKRDWPISRQLWWGHRIPVWSATRSIHSSGRVKEIDATFSKWTAEDRICTDPRTRTWDYGYFQGTPEILDDAGEYDFICVLRHDDSEVIHFIENLGFVQDPDVLDTWFSSALWPHSTLGWPEKTAELDRYYPTSVLVTSRDIITLWVARMVMTGLYNMEEVPFHDVYIHPTILDSRGERMSKTKGNGVDPVDIIETHGADALRFTLTGMATETQDARMPVQLICPHCQHRFDNPEGKQTIARCPKCGKEMTRPMGTAAGTPEAPIARATSEKFDIGRNFCNKLWNAGRFAIGNLEEEGRGTEARRHEGTEAGRHEGTEAQSEENASASSSSPSCLRASVPSCLSAPSSLSAPSLPDRWILSRLAKAITDIDAALATYRFDVYAKLCYDFFWRDFCDWYVEAIKPAMKDPARAAVSAPVLAAALDASLRLMHPMIPFITETIWWKLNDVRPTREIAGKYTAAPSKLLVTAAWPKGDGSLVDESAERDFALVQEVIGAIRNLRNEYKVDPKKPVTVSVLAAAAAAGLLRENRELVELLGVCELKAASPDLAPPRNASRLLAAGCEVFVEGLIDPAAEKQRVAKQREDLVKRIGALRGRLSNASYLAKAPPHLVKQTQDELAEAEAEMGKLDSQ